MCARVYALRRRLEAFGLEAGEGDVAGSIAAVAAAEACDAHAARVAAKLRVRPSREDAGRFGCGASLAECCDGTRLARGKGVDRFLNSTSDARELFGPFLADDPTSSSASLGEALDDARRGRAKAAMLLAVGLDAEARAAYGEARHRGLHGLLRVEDGQTFWRYLAFSARDANVLFGAKTESLVLGGRVSPADFLRPLAKAAASALYRDRLDALARVTVDAAAIVRLLPNASSSSELLNSFS